MGNDRPGSEAAMESSRLFPLPAAKIPASNRIPLGCLLAVTAGLQILIANFRPNLIWADEIYQVVEPAHHLVYGYGLTAWEYIVGMRSWLFPGVMAAVLWLGELFGSGPAFKFVPAQLFMVLCSLISVGVAYRWGERLDDARGGVVVGGFVAVWVDLLYFAPHPLSDVIAGDVLMAALYAALPLTTQPTPRRLAIAGALFGLTFALRPLLGPALLVAAIFACRRNLHAWGTFILGGTVVLLASGCLDWITLGAPFQSIWLSVWLNIAKGVSSDYGTLPAAFFFIAPILFWGFIPCLIVIAQFVVGSRRFPALSAVVIAIFLTQSLIAHKEWRFIFPALPPLITLCGIAALQEIRDISQRFNYPTLLAAAALTLWAGVSLVAALSPGYGPKWTLRRELLDAFALAARQPGLCAVNLVNILWIETPGSAALPTGIPIYASRPANLVRDMPGFNIAVSEGPVALPAAYRRLNCFQGSLNPQGEYQRMACVWRRSGGCVPGTAEVPTTNWPPYFTDTRGRPRLDRIRQYRHDGWKG